MEKKPENLEKHLEKLNKVNIRTYTNIIKNRSELESFVTKWKIFFYHLVQRNGTEIFLFTLFEIQMSEASIFHPFRNISGLSK